MNPEELKKRYRFKKDSPGKMREVNQRSSMNNHQSGETRYMEDAQGIIEKVREDIQNGKSDEEIFQFLLPDLGKDPQTDERVAESLAAIADVTVARLLHRMAEASTEKKVQKVIRRSLYRLKIRGILPDEPLPEKGVSILRPLKTEPQQGFGSVIDFLGRHLLVLAVPHPRTGLVVIQGLVSDTKGLIDVSEEELTRKGFKFFLEDLQKKFPVPLVEMEPSYVGLLFKEAYQLTLDLGRTPPKGYGGMKKEIEDVSKKYEKPLVYSHVRADDIVGDDRNLKRGADLLKTDLCSGWRIEDDEIHPYADALWEAEESKIILAQTQKEARFQEIYLKALSELFSGKKRLLYKRRLEETAYLFFKLGKEEEVKVSLANAFDLEKPVNPIQPNPFLFQLVVNSIFGLLREAYEKEKKEPSLLIKP